MEMGVKIISNFAASHHFPGPWDTEGGRHNRVITIHIRNDRGVEECESILDARDNVKLLRRVMNKAGVPDAPVATQKMWRPIVEASSDVPSTRLPLEPRKRGPKQARGRSDTEMREVEENDDPRYEIHRRHIWQIEPCPCARSVCNCPSHGQLTYKRDDGYDCNYIPGTMSTYCFAFFRKAHHCSVRQYSCYCRWCSRGKWDKCTFLHVVRHLPSKPLRPFDSGHRVWLNQGFRQVLVTPKSAPDRAVVRVATQSVQAAREYVAKLPVGATIASLTCEDGKRDFWLASKQSSIRKATKAYRDSGIKKGDYVFDIIWYDRMKDLKYMRVDYQSVLSVSSVLVTVSNISWHKTTTNRYYLGETTHNKLLQLVQSLSEI